MTRKLIWALILLGLCSCRSKPGDEGRPAPEKKPTVETARSEQLPVQPEAVGPAEKSEEPQDPGVEPSVQEGTDTRATPAQPSAEQVKRDKRKKEELITSANAPGPGEEVVAWSEKGRISKEEFERYLSRVPPFQRREYASLEKKIDLLKNLIKFDTLAGLARQEGLDADPDVLLALKTEMVKKLLQNKFGPDARVEVSEEQIRHRYEKDYTRYNKPARARASHIFIQDRKKAAQIHEELLKNIAVPGANTRKIFREFVRRYSQDEETKKRGGDLLFFSKDEVERGEKKIDPAVVEAVFAMQNTDQPSAPIKGKKGYHIVLLTNKRDPVSRTFEEARQEITDNIQRETLDKQRREFMENVVNFDAWHFETQMLQQIVVEGDPSSHDMQDRLRSIQDK